MSARHDTDLLSQAQQRRRKDEALSKIIGVDIKCLHLARHFLTDLALSDNAVVNELAWHIQKTVVDFLTRSTERNSMTDQVLFDNFNDALIAAHRQSRMVECRCAYAVQWPLGHCTVEFRKPSLRDQRMRVVECSDGREVLA